MPDIRKILIANRGEIAVRIARTCHQMGIDTVAVFSDADSNAPHVAFADEAVGIGPAPARDSYLRGDKILAAAERTGADAIHPGYGFLSENADFAQACRDRGKIFIGPSPEVIRLLGSKRESKRVVAEAGVAVVPGYHGKAQDVATLAGHAENVGFPILIKASAGGGGKGMRVVEQPDELPLAIEAARREAESAFADGTLLLERYIERPRHIEVQILADNAGNVGHLFERECSIQRRHQKIIEEAPALDAPLRAQITAAAVQIGKAVGYQNAGTVEFILAPDGQFYFLEVNTRLQVEHPVTECITGLDLVREQIRIARGEPLGFADIDIRGAAIECRLYAEDPERNFLPTTGRLVDFHAPLAEGVRVDSGVARGIEVGIHYDPMMAKIISHGRDRTEAIARMRRYLRRMSVHGITSNREFLIRILSHPEFCRGNIDTHFLERHAAELANDRLNRHPHAEAQADAAYAACAAALVAHEIRRQHRHLLPHLEPGFHNNRFAEEECRYEVLRGIDGSSTGIIAVRYLNLGACALQCSAYAEDTTDNTADNTHDRQGEVPAPVLTVTLSLVELTEVREGVFTLTLETRASARDEHLPEDSYRHRQTIMLTQVLQGPSPAGWASDSEELIWLVQSSHGLHTLREIPRFATTRVTESAGTCMAPMPGTVIKLLVAPGQEVHAGAPLLLMEAMKMEHTVTAAEGGTVSEILVTVGDQVENGQVLVMVTPPTEQTETR